MLANLALFQFMTTEVRRLVAASFVPVRYPFGAVIVREGDDADAFYVLVAGRARVLTGSEHGEEVPLGILSPGEGFGETALLENTTRTATIRASSDVEVLRLDRAVFRALVAQDPRIATSFELHRRRRAVQNFLRLHSAFADLPAGALTQLLDGFTSATVAPGDVVIREGDPPGPLYVVEEGRLRAVTQRDGTGATVAYLRRGDFFGELSLLRGHRRQATVEAVTECRLLRLDPGTYNSLLGEEAEFRRRIEQQAAQYDYRRVARVPLDFAEELLPADAVPPLPAPLSKDDDRDEPGTGPPEEEPTGDGSPFGSLRGRIRRFPHVWQVDEMDCGAACVAMMTRYFGRAVSLTHVRRAVNTGADGASLMGICRGAESLGLLARSVRWSRSRLDSLPVPAVAHFDKYHWIVVYDVGRRFVRVADPARGLRRLPRVEFEEKWDGFAALLAPTDAFESAPTEKPGMQWLWPFVRPYRLRLVVTGLLALVESALAMLFPVFTQIVIDRVIPDRDLALLNASVILMLAVLAVAVALSVVRHRVLASVTVRMDTGALDFVTGRLLALPTSYFWSRRTGDIQRRLAGVRQARELLVAQGVVVLTSSAQLLVALVLMVVYSRPLTLVFLMTLPGYVGLMRFASRRIRPLFDSLEETFGNYQAQQIDAIKGIETVKSLGAEDALRQRMRASFERVSHRRQRTDFVVMLYDRLVEMMGFLSLAFFLWFGARQVLAGNLSVGQLVSFNALVLLATGPLRALLNTWDDLQVISVLMNRLDDVFVQEPEQGWDHSSLLPVPTLSGEIRVRNLGFSPSGTSRPILEEITLDIRPGMTVALVGRSGSGKTTLAQCLAGLLEPTDGAITYDGLDLRRLSYRDLRRRIGFVLQENYVFDDTISGNIALGEPEPDVERVVAAARAAYAHEFVERLPFAYETRVGETGLRLSGGQKQRIAIARALYHNPPVLILDEATSALDTEAERAVQESMARLVEDRTSIVIAHRLSTIRHADLIVVLEKGRIVERGTHDQLLDQRGLYFYLVSQQLAP